VVLNREVKAIYKSSVLEPQRERMEDRDNLRKAWGHLQPAKQRRRQLQLWDISQLVRKNWIDGDRCLYRSACKVQLAHERKERATVAAIRKRDGNS
jgi:hypothetical protein